MGFDRVHLVVFYNESKVPPTVQDVYGDASCETTWAQHKRLSWEPVPFRPINASVPLDGKPRDFDPNYKAPAITKAYNALRSRYDWIAILDNDELVFRNGTGALDDGCPADAPIVAGLRTSLAGRKSKDGSRRRRGVDAERLLTQVSGRRVRSHHLRVPRPVRFLAAARAAPGAEVARARCLQRSDRAPASRRQTVRQPTTGQANLEICQIFAEMFRCSLRLDGTMKFGYRPGDKGQRSCFKSLHRTAGPQRLGGKFSMHIGNGPHVQITPARPGALAVSHIRGKSLWWHPSAAVNATTARDNVFFDEVRRRAACSSLSRDARDASGRPGEK